MGAGIAWNFIPALGVQTTPQPVSIHYPLNSSSTTLYGTPNTTGSNGAGAKQSLPTSLSQVNVSSQQWINYAQVAWSFFKPGIGVSPSTGLIYASPYWHEFTDWDLAGYIQAVLAAERIGLISESGPWGADYRLSLVLNFLDTRALNSNGLWYQFYNSDSGTVSADGLNDPGGISDGGPMLIALYDLMQAHPRFTSQVREAVTRVNYKLLASQGFGPDLYSQYAKLGFDLWNFSSSSSDVYPLSVGNMAISEPAMLAILENTHSMDFERAGQEIYSAQYAAYNRTGDLFALSEGQYPPYLNSTTPYVYESIEVPSGKNYQVITWQGQTINSSPEDFVKIGFAFLAIYRSSYGELLVNTLGNLTTSDGYSEGLLSQTGQVFGAVSDNTNIMIMLACAYGFSHD